MAKEIQKDLDLEAEANHSELRVYELGFHIDPELPQEEAKKVYQSIKDQIAASSSVIAEGEIEKIPLAYTISRMDTTGRRDFNSAYFGWVAYEADGAGHEAVAEAARTNSAIFRFLDLRTTKDAAKHSAEMHEFYSRAPQSQEGDEVEEAPEVAAEPVEAELDAALKEVGA
jgi:ribosomal protein S6